MGSHLMLVLMHTGYLHRSLYARARIGVVVIYIYIWGVGIQDVSYVCSCKHVIHAIQCYTCNTYPHTMHMCYTCCPPVITPRLPQIHPNWDLYAGSDVSSLRTQNGTPFWGSYNGTYLHMYQIQGYPRIFCTGVDLCYLETPKWDPFWGCYPGPVERVFNKTRCSDRSLYARARTGVVDLGVNLAIGPQIDLLNTPTPVHSYIYTYV